MNFQELTDKVGFGMAVALQQEELCSKPDFWQSLPLERLLAVYFEGGVTEKTREIVFVAIRKLATTFDDLRRIFTYSASKTPVREWALLQIEPKAATFQERTFVACHKKGYDLGKLLPLANGFEDLIALARLAHEDSPPLIDSVISRLAELEDMNDRVLISAYFMSTSPKVREFLLDKIRGLDISAGAWRSIFVSVSDPKIRSIATSKVLASVASFEDCKLVYDSCASLSVQGQGVALDKALGFAKTFEQCQWIAERHHPASVQAIEKMAEYAQTIQEWRKVFFASREGSSLRQRAFEEMKKLAAA